MGEIRFVETRGYPYLDARMVYICKKFHENILDSIGVIMWTQFSEQKFQSAIIP